MKIYSKFQDYYDCALGSFIESDVQVYRVQSTVVENYKSMPDLKDFDGRWNYHTHEQYGHAFGTEQLHMIGFCGTWYFYVELLYKQLTELRYVTFDEIVKNNHTNSMFHWEDEFKDPNNEQYWKDLFEKYGPVLYCKYRKPAKYEHSSESSQMKIEIWPELKQHKFIQVKNPYTALWEIEHWFDSHARPDDAIVPVGDDITRLQAYGFDKKTSFRKVKEK